MSIDLPPRLVEELLVHRDASLAERTTLGVGGPAPWVIEPRRREELILAVEELSSAGLPYRLLGHGSNLLVADGGVPEVVLHTRSLIGLYHHGEQDDALRCEAGVPLSRLVSVAHQESLSGVECLIGIPGTVGGAVAGNSGGRDGAIGDVLSEVTVVDPDGTVRAVACTPDDFAYRSSPFAGQVIVDAVVQLRPEAKARVFERMTAVLRAKADSQPLTAWSAGCMFRNPPGDSSGRLIEAAGCKGLAVGDARVSERHANFLVNTGAARAADVLALVSAVQQRVAAHSGRELELEVETWGALEQPAD